MPIILENPGLRLSVDPAAGVSVLAFHAFHERQWLPLMPDVREPGCDLRHAGFIMAPYSNRIENGAFSFRERTVQLDRGDEHSIHGDVRTRAWSVQERTCSMVRCRLDTATQDQLNWPWPFVVEAAYRLEEMALVSELQLTNTAAEPAPAGFGWHPFFSRSLTRDGEPVMLQLGVERVFPDANNNRIPSGPAAALHPDQDFSSERELSPDSFLDACFAGYDGDGRIGWPETGIEVELACSDVCTHLVLYNPAGKPYFAVEPVTNANNGVNLLTAGEPDNGVVILDPGETLSARFDLRIKSLR